MAADELDFAIADDELIADELIADVLDDDSAAALELDTWMLDVAGELELLGVGLVLEVAELMLDVALLFVVLVATQAPRLQAAASNRLRCVPRCSNWVSGLSVGIMFPCARG